MKAIDHNPFASRYTRPRAMVYRFPPGQDVAGLLEAFARNGRRGQILGPHGSGKSTLVGALAAEWERRRGAVLRIDLRDSQRSLPHDARVSLAAPPTAPRLLVIDGYEQLGAAARLWVGWRCWRDGWGLLVTAHCDMGLPTLAATRVDLPLARELTRRLAGPDAIPEDAIEAAFERHGGNLREVWFELYDLYERRRASGLLGAGPTPRP